MKLKYYVCLFIKTESIPTLEAGICFTAIYSVNTKEYVTEYWKTSYFVI